MYNESFVSCLKYVARCLELSSDGIGVDEENFSILDEYVKNHSDELLKAQTEGYLNLLGDGLITFTDKFYTEAFDAGLGDASSGLTASVEQVYEIINQ